jgi:hypothetical protein
MFAKLAWEETRVSDFLALIIACEFLKMQICCRWNDCFALENVTPKYIASFKNEILWILARSRKLFLPEFAVDRVRLETLASNRSVSNQQLVIHVQ